VEQRRAAVRAAGALRGTGALTRRAGAAAFAVALGWSVCARAAEVPPPDPQQGDGRVSAFYTWVGPIPEQPGHMLRTETLPGVLGLPAAGRQERILYTSTDGVAGEGPVVVSGAVFLPKARRPPAAGR
jgi:hypothetical protein